MEERPIYPGIESVTYEDYWKLPETNLRHEVIDGKIVMLPHPTVEHQSILGQLAYVLHQFAAENDLGQVLFAPLDVVVERQPLRVRQPDLIYISRARSGIIKDVIEGGPDLIAEVLLSGESPESMEDRLADYARLGVRECWLVSPEASTVEALAGADNGWRRLGLYGLGDTVGSRVFEGLMLPVAEIFG